MQDQSANLKLPYMMAAQAQKHVTHNEALRALDAIVQIGVVDRDLATPPAAPGDGVRYIVGAGASGAWAGKDGQIAAFQDGAWAFYAAQAGWVAFVGDEAALVVHDGTGWAALPGGAAASSSIVLNASTSGASTRFDLVEEELTLAGPEVVSAIVIPDRAIVLAVTTRTTATITGALSYDCGIAGEPAKYGGSLGTAAGSTNAGVTGPTAYYAATPVCLSANGGNFTGGTVRLAIHYLLCTVPTN